MAIRDYRAWHDDYDRPGSRLHLRLLVVQDLVARALDELPPGPVRVVSMCAGQGRDLVGVARRHRRGRDITGRLVELDPANVAAARDAIDAAHLDALEVVEGDAGVSDAYAGAAPADLLLACGIFGNVPDGDIERTVRFLPALCAPGARVVWTRHPQPADIIERIESWLTESGFAVTARVVPDEPRFGVGAATFNGAPAALAAGVRLFEFDR